LQKVSQAGIKASQAGIRAKSITGKYKTVCQILFVAKFFATYGASPISGKNKTEYSSPTAFYNKYHTAKQHAKMSCVSTLEISNVCFLFD